MKNEYMEVAIKESLKAYKKGEVPVGAVIVKNNKIIAKSHNTIEKKKNAINHAEINAIRIASKKLKNWRLIDCDLYVTLQPCKMCEGAIELSRIQNVYYAASRNETNFKNKFKMIKLSNYNSDYLNILKNFFKDKR